MICKLKQTKSDFSSEYELYYNDKVIAVISTDNNMLCVPDIMIRSGLSGCIYYLRYSNKMNFSNVVKSSDDKSYNPYLIYNEHNEQIGCMYLKNGGKRVFDKYEYLFLELNGNEYQMYPIGFGKEGYKYPLYDSTQQIALVEKDCVVINNLDEYDIFAKDDFSANIALIMAVYIDAQMFARRGEIVEKSVVKSYSKSFSKELKAKYNPEFKNHISAD